MRIASAIAELRTTDLAESIRFNATEIWLLLVAFALLPGTCLAGGTVRLEEVEPLLRQAPTVRALLMSSLDLDDTVIAAVRFGSHVGRLGGARVGPYTIHGRPKGSNGGSALEIVLCTRARFFDESGKAIESEIDAVRVEERLTAVMLRESKSAPAIPTCPDE